VQDTNIARNNPQHRTQMNHQLVEEELADSVQSRGRIALRLHMTGGAELELPASADWPTQASSSSDERASGEVVRFDSLAQRNAAVAEHLYQKLKRRGRVGATDLFGVAHTLWIREVSRLDTAAGRLLAHVESEQDVFSLAEEHIANGGEVFDVVQVIGTMLQHVDYLKLDTMIKLARAQFDQTKHDLMVGLFFDQLAQWMAPRPDRARELLQVASNADDLATEGLLSVAIGAIFRENAEEGLALAVSEINSERLTRRRSGRWMLGQFLLKVPDASIRMEIEKRIAEGLRSGEGDALQDWIRVAGVALHASSEFDEPMLRLCTDENEAALTAVARALFLKGRDLVAQNRVSMWLPSLVAYSAGEAFPALDHALTNLLEQDADVQPSVTEFLTSWATRHSGPTAIETNLILGFGQTIRKLVSKAGSFESLITRWLLAPDRRLAAAAAGILGDLEAEGLKSIRLDGSALTALTQSEMAFLARRLLGYVHSTSHVVAMSLSMLQVREEQLGDVLPVMDSLIVAELGYDYPGTVVEALAAMRPTETRQPVLVALDNWRRAIQAQQEAIEHLPRRNELWPPSLLQRQFALARARQMHKASEEASENSVFSQIATKIPLKAGRGFFNHSQGKFSEPTPLHTLSYSVEVPRREVLDPVGNAIRGIQLRLASEGQE
jgi:hypothetical protein